jgi:hypothetical protein
MKATATKTAPAPQTLAQRFKDRILHGYLVRIHMSLILSAVTVSGVLTSKGLMEAGVVSLRFRYPVAVLCSYLVFLGLVRIWIWYVCRRQAMAASNGSGWDLGNLDFRGSSSGGASFGGGGGGGGGGGSVGFGGGDSGGGGASSLWEADAAAGPGPMPVIGPEPVSASSGGGGWSLPDIDLGDDGWEIVLLLVVLVLAIVLAGGYLIYAAPQILPEAAWQAVLASTLTRVKKDDHHGWMSGVVKSTVLPFAVIMVLAGALGWVSHKHCPTAKKLAEVFYCKAD